MTMTKDVPDRLNTRDFLIAAALQQLEMVCYFIEKEGVHPDTTRSGKPTALCYSAMAKNRCMLTYLVKKGADVNYQDALGMTPLHYAVLGGCVYCTAYLVHHGSKLNTRNRDAHTPLKLALRTPGAADCCALLKCYGTGELSSEPIAEGTLPDGLKRFH